MSTDDKPKPRHDYHPQGFEPSLTEPETDHESGDINIRGVVGFGLGLAICTVLVCLVMYGAFKLLVNAFTTKPVTETAMVGTREPQGASAAMAKSTFPEPRLQTDYFGDLAKVREQWDERLHGYGVDPKTGRVYIPIERAMELTLQRGLPARSAAEMPGPNSAPAGKTQTPKPRLGAPGQQ